MSSSISRRAWRRLPIVSVLVVIAISISFLAGTPPSSARSGRLIVLAGDIACAPDDPHFNHFHGAPGYCHMKATARLVRGLHPVAVLALGDEQYNRGSRRDLRASYAKTWGVFKRITYPVVGNHEYGTRGAAGYFHYFGARAKRRGSRCKSYCHGYYSFHIGAWHIVAINTECSRISHGAGCAVGSPQYKWLKADLARHRNRCTLVFGHRPRWSSNGFASDDIAPLIKLMYQAHVDIYASGHSHAFEIFRRQSPSGKRQPKRGIKQMVIGTGGSFYTGFGKIRQNSRVHEDEVFGVMALTLHPGRWNYRFVSIRSTPFHYSGHGVCH